MINYRKALRPAFISAACAVMTLLLQPGQTFAEPPSLAQPKFSEAVAFDISPAVRNITALTGGGRYTIPTGGVLEIRPDRGPEGKDKGFGGDGALGKVHADVSAAKKSDLFANFESNSTNFDLSRTMAMKSFAEIGS